MSLATYDPNIRWAKHTVEIDLQMWEYRLTVAVVVNGNCKGFSILESAISTYADELYEAHGDRAELILRKSAADGVGEDTLECAPDDDDIEGWLEGMCVGLRIVKHEEEDDK